MIKEISVKSALHYHDRAFATNWDLNIYRGCQHKCKYCFAQYSHRYLDDNADGFFDDIYVKTNIAQVLDKELSKKSWCGDPIQISGVTDCYQPLEKKYRLMRQVLEILIKHRQPASILTKSPLMLRDYDLLKELSEVAQVSLASTVTTLNEDIRKKIEPGTFSSLERLNMMKEFTNLNCETTIMFVPIIPYLTDNTRDIEEMYKIVSEYGINNIVTGVLNMRGRVKDNFYDFLRREYRDTYEKIQPLYTNSAYVSKDYNRKLGQFLSKMRKKYKLARFNRKNFPPLEKEGQMDLFSPENRNVQLELFR